MAKKSGISLTKAAKGFAFGDVSNIAIRNVLSEISKCLNGTFTAQEMEETLDFFDWKCPYTGKDLKPLILGGLGGYVTDHIYPQNAEWCGLNVKGNLVFADRRANSEKDGYTIEDFLLKNDGVLAGVDMKTRRERLDKIREFQKLCGYDPESVRREISPLMKTWYDEIRRQQEDRIAIALGILRSKKVYKGTATAAIPAATVPATVAASGETQLVFHPADEKLFKDGLIKSKKAHFELTYDTGVVKKTPWRADRFTASSNLRGNIESKTFWRHRKSEGLIRVDVYLD